MKLSSGKVGLKHSSAVKTKIKYYIRYVDSLQVDDRGGGGKKNKYVLTLNSSSCNDNSRRGPPVRDNQSFVLNCDTRPFFIGQETSILAR